MIDAASCLPPPCPPTASAGGDDVVRSVYQFRPSGFGVDGVIEVGQLAATPSTARPGASNGTARSSIATADPVGTGGRARRADDGGAQRQDRDQVGAVHAGRRADRHGERCPVDGAEPGQAFPSWATIRGCRRCPRSPRSSTSSSTASPPKPPAAECEPRAQGRPATRRSVLACLLHDIGVIGFIRSDHGYWGAQLIEPYVDEKVSLGDPRAPGAALLPGPVGRLRVPRSCTCVFRRRLRAGAVHRGGVPARPQPQVVHDRAPDHASTTSTPSTPTRRSTWTSSSTSSAATSSSRKRASASTTAPSRTCGAR